MASNSKSSFVLAIFFACLVMAANAGRIPPPPPSPTIVKACSNAKYRNFCVQSLSSAPGALEADMKQLAVIAVQLSLNEAQTVTSYVEYLKKLEICSSALKNCVELFKDTVFQLHISLSSLMRLGKEGSNFKEDLSDARTRLSAANKDRGSCFYVLASQQSTFHRLKRRTHYLSKLMSDAVAVTAKLADQHNP